MTINAVVETIQIVATPMTEEDVIGIEEIIETTRNMIGGVIGTMTEEAENIEDLIPDTSIS